MILVLLGVFVVQSREVSAVVSESVSLPSIQAMPDAPSPYVLRDWKHVARSFDKLVFEADMNGTYLPLIWPDTSRSVNDIDGFALPSYVGDWRQMPETNIHEGITGLSAVIGASLVGIDKSNLDGVNYVEMLAMHFHEKDGIGLYLNRYNPGGASYWYDLYPNLLFYHVYSLYPEIKSFKEQMVSIAEEWREVLISLGASESSLPDFDHTGFDFIHKKPIQKEWVEADAPAGIAYLEYLAYRVTRRMDFLEAAQWSMDWLEARTVNPHYECLMPYGAYVAARSNAERGTEYDVAKYFEWVLAGDNPRKWGAILEKWGDYEAYGLIGSVYPKHEYAFAMNTFQAVGIMAPIARYDDRFAQGLAKWILNVAVNSRYFYPNAWPAKDQSSYDWAARYDPEFSIPYEGLRKRGVLRAYPGEGKALDGRLIYNRKADKGPARRMLLRPGENGKLLCEWRMTIPDEGAHQLVVRGRNLNDSKGGVINFSIKASGEENFQPVFSFSVDSVPTETWAKITLTGEVVIRAEATALNTADRVQLDEFYLKSRLSNVPHVGGDPTVYGWGRTDLGLYGGAFVGYLAALVEPSSVDGIIEIDPVATDVFSAATYPTRLIYNPFDEPKELTLRTGDASVDVYDALSSRFIRRGVHGEFDLTLPAKETVMLVYCPSGGRLSRDGEKLFCEGVLIDYSH